MKPSKKLAYCFLLGIGLGIVAGAVIDAAVGSLFYGIIFGATIGTTLGLVAFLLIRTAEGKQRVRREKNRSPKHA